MFCTSHQADYIAACSWKSKHLVLPLGPHGLWVELLQWNWWLYLPEGLPLFLSGGFLLELSECWSMECKICTYTYNETYSWKIHMMNTRYFFICIWFHKFSLMLKNLKTGIILFYATKKLNVKALLYRGTPSAQTCIYLSPCLGTTVLWGTEQATHYFVIPTFL